MDYNYNPINMTNIPNGNNGNRSKKGKTALIIILIILALLLVTLFVFLIFSSQDEKLKKCLTLGQQYLTEMKYEQAIASYEKALKIDPTSVDAYLGMTDAYVGLGDFESAKKTLEKGIKTLEVAGLDTALLENRMDELSNDIAIFESGQTNGIFGGDEFNETSVDDQLPTISIEPIMAVLSNVWGKNWLDWTIDDFVLKFNLTEYEATETGEFWREEPLSFQVPLEREPRIYYSATFKDGYNELTVISSDKVIFTTEMITMNQYGTFYTQYIYMDDNLLVHDNFYEFAEANGINSIDDVGKYFGIDLEELYDVDAPLLVNTEYGTAEISHTNFGNESEGQEWIKVSNISGLEGLCFGFESLRGELPSFDFFAEQHY